MLTSPGLGVLTVLQATQSIAVGNTAVAAVHEGAATLARAWANSDSECRSSLSEAIKSQEVPDFGWNPPVVLDGTHQSFWMEPTSRPQGPPGALM